MVEIERVDRLQGKHSTKLIWSHNAELDYARGLIDDTHWFHFPHKCQIPKHKLLKNYIESATKRMENDTYVKDGEIIIDIVKRAYERELAKVMG